MNGTMLRRVVRLASAAAVAFHAGGCGLLDVNDPTAVEESDLEDAAGGMLLHGDAVRRLAAAVSQSAWHGGLMADEFLFDLSPFAASTQGEDVIDRRQSERLEQEADFTAAYIFAWPVEARRAASAAIQALRSYGNVPALLGEAFAVRGYATLLMAEQFCPGFPLHDVKDYQPVYSGPLSTDEAFSRAMEDLATAAEYAADSAQILNFVRVAQGRALLGRGEFGAAAAAVAAVPSYYQYMGEFGESNIGGAWNQLPETYFAPSPFGGEQRSVSDREGGNGLDFASADDPRVQVYPNGRLHDEATPLYALAKYPDTRAPIVLASGIEARLVEAEAALDGGDPSWLTILNELRRNQITPAQDALEDPGGEDARVDLLFRERAFWLFATAHRLGDLRRLVAHYGRSAESVFPSGTYRTGGDYGSATSLPFAAAHERSFNPGVVGCTSR